MKLKSVKCILFQHLYSFMAGDSGPPVWPALTYLTADCNYGGRVSDDDNDDDDGNHNNDDHRYAKIRPRTRPQLPEPGEPRLVTSKSQDMWAAPAARWV